MVVPVIVAPGSAALSPTLSYDVPCIQLGRVFTFEVRRTVND